MNKIKRRKFIKISILASAALPTRPNLTTAESRQKKGISLNQRSVLKDFNDEHEESPSLVTDGNGNIWLFSLRRMSYPENRELISSFYFDGISWLETDPVTKSAGMYESPTASCALGGKPVVAWTEVKGNEWSINVSQMEKDSFGKPHLFSLKKGRSINPVLISPNKNRSWIAWECLHDGVFSIYVSKYEYGRWSEPISIDKGSSSCFTPALAEAQNGDLYIAYGVAQGFHQNIEMLVLNSKTLNIRKTIPIAVGGGHKDRVNINAKPSLAFDNQDNLWISYENNRNVSRFEDGDNYTGDRCCAILSYQNDKIVEIESEGKWLFNGENDHRPTFIRDAKGILFLVTYCGGNFTNRTWKYRISWLDPKNGWKKPITLFDTKIKGLMITPSLAFDNNGNFWLSSINEKTFYDYEKVESQQIEQSRLTELNLSNFTTPDIDGDYKPRKFSETVVKEFIPDERDIGPLSGHPKLERMSRTIDGEEHTLIYGNLHEHSNSSNCWPAGTDGSLDEDYRFGMFSEGYDFIGLTDHAASTSEIHWRKNLRMADFYNESKKFVAIPAVEWTLQSDPKLDDIQYGAGHYNVIFTSTEDARKYIRNKHEIYSPRIPESKIAPTLWKLLKEKEINCVTIPHHTADKIHPLDWNVSDAKFVTTVEIFQCRGNNEYPGCPRERNLTRHTPTHHKRAYIDYALKVKKYKLGFIASGDHNNMGIGVAALWVKEISRKGIIEALQKRRSFATTGDKMLIDFEINGAFMGTTVKLNKVPELAINIKAQYPLEKVEILRNSNVIHKIQIDDNSLEFNRTYSDQHYKNEKEVLYYYVRATQLNKAIAWSSPIWIDML